MKPMVAHGWVFMAKHSHGKTDKRGPSLTQVIDL